MPDDTSGTGQWRCLWPINILWPMLRGDENITVSKTLPKDPNFFAVQNSVMIQRWTTAYHRNMFDTVVFPAASGGMCNIIYNIDDCLSPDEIPLFNPAWLHYSKPEIQENIKHIISRADFVLVTNTTLGQYYIDKYSINSNNIIVMPNLLPRSLAYGLYNRDLKTHQFAQTKAANKIRIGIISSASHFNINGVKQTKDTKELVVYDNEEKKYKVYTTNRFVENESELEEVPDDIDDIIDVIRKTSDKFEWISIGASANATFKQLVDDNLIKVVEQTDILHYMQLVSKLNLSAIVAPVKDNLFAHCKSDIKYLEAAAVGAVLYTPDCKPYIEHVPTAQRWTSTVDLIEKLYKLSETSPNEFSDMIQAQYDWLNSPTQVEGGPYIQNWWLDDNINIWRSVFFMPRKGVKIHLSSIVNNPEKQDNNIINEKKSPATYGKSLLNKKKGGKK